MQAIILAGGKGRRLMPYTTVLPKPLMPIGDYPIIEVILRQLKRCGFSKVSICTGYLHELIHAYLDSNKTLGLKIAYSHEKIPLGTIGPLRLIDNLNDTFLVMNGDILTDLDYRKLIEAHKKYGAIATVATYKRDVNIDFGVLEQNAEHKIIAFREKPTFHFDVSMGIYVFSKKILDYVPADTPFGFDQLMYALTERNEAVYSYPHTGYWLDIGRPDDYARSIEEFERYKDRFLP
ncbi:MAG: sugar phosphate nucleotidyltransferase [Methanoregula sp.]|nr:sugar phosphate nucleotidyltransferase [Methanoregula sp.]